MNDPVNDRPITNVAICDRRYTMTDTDNFMEIFKNRDVPATAVVWDDIQFSASGIRLPGVDADPAQVAVLMVSKVWTRYGGSDLLYLFNEVSSLRAMGYRVINPDLRHLDKWLAGCRLAAAGIPTPPTWLVNDVAEVSELYHQRGPVILKPRVGRQGLGQVRLDRAAARFNDTGIVIGMAESAIWESLHRYGTLVCQDLLEEPMRELRIQVAGDRVLAAMEVSRPGPALRVFDPTARLAEIATSAVEVLGWAYGELDVIERDGEYFVLEVNPVINGDSYARGDDVAEPFLGLNVVADLLVRGDFA
jgi:glutathione synthase/RimK-type ligase-like ATP-grasp enzyme